MVLAAASEAPAREAGGPFSSSALISKHASPPLSIDKEVGGAIPQSDASAITVTTLRRPLVGKSLAHFIAGGAGGMTAAILTSPLDVVKTRLQSDFYQTQIAARRASSGVQISHQGAIRSGLRHFQETFELLYDVYKVEGPRALFKGLGPNLVGVVPARAINFYTYGNGKRIIAERFNNGVEASWVHLCAAATAGIVTGTATNPIWLVKTRLQLDKDRTTVGTRQYRNSWDCIKQTVRNEGFRGLYKGLSASYLGVTESTLQWVLYERMKMALARREEVRLQSSRQKTGWDSTVEWTGKLGAAGCAKLIATGVTYPHEVVRTRLRQAPLAKTGKPKYTGLVQCFKLILKEEGLVSMYGGMTSHMLKVVPSSAIMFGMYEIILRAFGTDASLAKA